MSRLVETLADRLSQTLGDHYRFERELGAGGMATVYLAEDLKHHRKVAIKVLREDLSASVGASRFLREIEIAARLQHPNILGLLDSGNADGLLYYVMPFVEGQSLRQRLAREAELPVSEALRVLIEVVDALAYAHAHGVVHRDIKPDNVMLSGRHALVADFGVARALSEASGSQTLTSMGVALGTPVYMSPEQATADVHIDHRADVYSVGVLAYELLAGRPPFTGSSPQQVLAAHVTEAPELLSKRRPGVSSQLERVVMRCLEKRPADRWQSSDELLRELEQLATPSGGTQPTDARLRPITQRSRRFPLIGGLVAACALAIAMLAWRYAPALFGGGETAPLVIGNASQFTTDDGLEIDPAISPDGKLVAYAAGKETQMRIFIRPVSGGRTIGLSEDPSAFEFQPRWSPDGSRILYITPTGVFIAAGGGGGGGPRIGNAEGPRSFSSQLSTRLGVSSATWSPDGSRIAIARGGVLSIASANGENEKELVTSPYELHSCRWAPIGEWLACASGNAEGVVPGRTFGNIAPSAIVLISTTDGRLREITGRTELNQSPAWSPDGQRVYFVSNRQGPRDVYAADIARDGSLRREPARVTTGLGAQSIAFSGDGSRLVYVAYAARSNVWSIPVPSGTVTGVAGARPMTTGNQVVEGLSVSPDGRWLLYDSNLYGNADLFRVPVAGGSAERLTTHSADDFVPDLSHDGREIVFHSWRTGTRDLFVQSLDGQTVQQVTNTPGQESYPRWSPDGRAIAFCDQQNSRGLFIVWRDTAGRWGTPRGRRERAGCRVAWTRDGRFVVYARDGAIEAVPADSGVPKVIYAPRDGATGPNAESVELGESDRVVYFKSHDANQRASFWSVPFAGGAPRLLLHVNDPTRPSIRPDFAAGAGRLFFTIEDRQSDVWVAEVTPARK